MDLAPGNALVAGMRLREFEIIETLGEGGFSIVYGARDLQLMREVAIKEYIPVSLAGRVASTTVRIRSEHNRETFEAGLNGFINEARLLAQFKHAGLVEVLQFWEENGTAYMVMPRYTGKTLRSVLKEMGGRGDEPWLRGIVAPVLDVLELLHSRNVFHRDIAPDNILIKNDGTPVLLDLGSAREVVTGLQKAITVVVKPGYAPIEQYSSDFALPQGPWTDVYAVGALLHFAILGSPPPASISRIMKDSLQPLAAAGLSGYSREFLHAVDSALALQPGDRPQSIAELRALLRVTEHDRTVISLAPPPEIAPAILAAAPATAAVEAPPIADPVALGIGLAGSEDERTVIVSAQEVAALVQQLAVAKAAASVPVAAEAVTPAPAAAADAYATVLPPAQAEASGVSAVPAPSSGVDLLLPSLAPPPFAMPVDAPPFSAAAIEAVALPVAGTVEPSPAPAAAAADVAPSFTDTVLPPLPAAAVAPFAEAAVTVPPAFVMPAGPAAPADAVPPVAPAADAVSAQAAAAVPAADMAVPTAFAMPAAPAEPAAVQPAAPLPVAPAADPVPAQAAEAAPFSDPMQTFVMPAPAALLPTPPSPVLVPAPLADPVDGAGHAPEAVLPHAAVPVSAAAVPQAPAAVPMELTLEPMDRPEPEPAVEPPVAELRIEPVAMPPPFAVPVAAAATSQKPPAEDAQRTQATQPAPSKEAERTTSPAAAPPSDATVVMPAPAALALARRVAATAPPAVAANANDATVVMSAPVALAKPAPSPLDLDPLAHVSPQPQAAANSFPEMEDLLSGRLATEARAVVVPPANLPPAAAAAPTASAARPAPRAWLLPAVAGSVLVIGAALLTWYLGSGSGETPVPPPIVAEVPASPAAVSDPAPAVTEPATAALAPDPASAPPTAPDAGTALAQAGTDVPPPPAADGGAPALDPSQVIAPLSVPSETTSASFEGPGQTIAPPPPPVVAETAATPAKPTAPPAGDMVKTVDLTAATPARGDDASARARERDAAARAKRDAKPAMAATGNVKLSIQPWGEVWINGSRKGVSPPMRFLQLEPGTYDIELRNPGLQSSRRQLVVTAGQQFTVEHRFQSAGSGAAQ